VSGTNLGVSGIFFALAAWFFLAPATDPYPSSKPVRAITPEDISTAPRRVRMTEPPGIGEGAFRLSCQECHKLFPSDRDVRVRLSQHEDIHLNHGLNSWCFNCHSLEDRNKLVLEKDEEIGFDRVEELCAKCHGTVYRDWERGMHGRTNGYWDTSAGEAERLVCTQCHDPHSPAYSSYEPLPGPNTLRMGEPLQDGHDERKRNPLMQWRGQSGQESGHEPTQADHESTLAPHSEDEE